jgi:hypothetical protein
VRFSRKNHESVPGESGVGNEALRKVRRVGYEGESRSRPRSSRVESVEGMGDGCGATKMVFSTLATTRGMRERRTRGLRFFI